MKRSRSNETAFSKTAVIFVLICCLCLASCGKAGTDTESRGGKESSQSTQPLADGGISAQPLEGEDKSEEESSRPAGPTSIEEIIAMDSTPMPDQVIPEGREVVTLGTFGEVLSYRQLYKAVSTFNQVQDKYFVYVEEYSSYNRFLMDIARKQGMDLYSFSPYGSVSKEALVSNGVLEDLTPYFEKSDIISRENMVDSVWRAGSVEDRLYFLIPSFRCRGLLVEKGTTKEGAWSGKDYIELGLKNPGCMLTDGIQTNPANPLIGDLQWYMSAFINWEDLTCSFDSDEFIGLLESLKTLGDYKYEDADEDASPAELIRERVYLTTSVLISLDYGLRSYRDITDAFGDDYEIAGFPSADGSLQYGMIYDEIYCMNAASGNKEGAWAFLEYLLSEDYQQPDPPIYDRHDDSTIATMLNGAFPARKDMLEKGLQANVDYVDDPMRVSYRTNRYDGETEKGGYGGTTKEDKEAIWHIIDNAYRPSFDVGDHTLLIVLQEETDPFFLGQKTAEEVADIIQSRLSLYLAEYE